MAFEHLERRVFPNGPEHALVRRLLLEQDGSTTRLCAALAGGALEMSVVVQERRTVVPAAVREALGGTAWLERVTSLHAGSAVFMDNLSFTRLDTVPGWFLEGLDRGAVPIGRLLQQLYVRREAAPSSAEVAQLLWEQVGLPDPSMSRSYVVRMPQAPLMYIYEVFRAGMVAAGSSSARSPA